MTVITIILGIILMIGGVACMFTPLASFIAVGYIVAIALLVFGVFALIQAIRQKTGPLAYVTSILAIIVGIIALFIPGGTLVFDTLLLIFVAVWFLVQGVSSLVLSIQCRHEKKNWGLGVASGILGIAAGIICIIFPGAEIFAVGILIGIFLLVAGLNLVTVGSVFGGRRQ